MVAYIEDSLTFVHIETSFKLRLDDYTLSS